MIRILVKGASGRMGQRITALAKEDPDFNVVSTLEGADVMIDFSHPDITLKYLGEAVQNKIPSVIGTTGFTPQQLKEIQGYAKKLPFVLDSNMSIGVNVMWKVLEQAAKTLGNDFKVQVTETHHVHKKDKPSGTAKKIVEILAKALGMKPEEIPVESKREGEVVGDHTTLFISPGETLEITHKAASRDIFALGALRAAKWIIGKPNGIYSMFDLLGLK